MKNEEWAAQWFIDHRLSQILIVSFRIKVVLCCPCCRLYFGTEIHGFFKDTAWLCIDTPRHFVITACCSQVHGLVSFFIDFVDGWLHLSIARASSALRSVRAAILHLKEPCLYLSIAFSIYSHSHA